MVSFSAVKVTIVRHIDIFSLERPASCQLLGRTLTGSSAAILAGETRHYIRLCFNEWQ